LPLAKLAPLASPEASSASGEAISLPASPEAILPLAKLSRPCLPVGEANASWQLPVGNLAPHELFLSCLGQTLLGFSCPRNEVLPLPLPLAFLVPRVTRRQHFERALDTRRGISKLSRLGGSRTYLRESPVPDFTYFHVIIAYNAYLPCHARTRTNCHDIHVIFMINTCHLYSCHVKHTQCVFMSKNITSHALHLPCSLGISTYIMHTCTPAMFTLEPSSSRAYSTSLLSRTNCMYTRLTPYPPHPFLC